MQQQIHQIRSKIKRRCKLKTASQMYKDGSMFQKPKFLLNHYLQIDYETQTLPYQLSIKDIETYGAYSDSEMKMIFQKVISRDSLQKIIIDAMKLCYLYHPIMQAIQSELKSNKDEYKIKDVLNLIFKSSFYPFLMMKTQPAMYLINNRNTEINVKSLVSAIFAFVSGRLTIQNLSDTALFYRLEEALYDTAPNGLPYEFGKIMKSMKKIDRNITGENFNKWERKITEIQHNIKYLQPYHFVYLISLSQPIKKKKANIFEVDKKQSKFQKQTQMLNVIKDKSNFIDQNNRKVDWRKQIKVRGLSFQERSISEKIDFMQKQFVDMRKKIISHKRTKSAYVTSQAIGLVKQDLKKNNLKENQYLLDTFLSKSCFRKQNERTLLKKHNKKLMSNKQFQKNKIQEQKKFKEFYNIQLTNHLAQAPIKDEFSKLMKPSFFPTQKSIHIEETQSGFANDMNEQKMLGFFQKNTKIFKKNSSKCFRKGKQNQLKLN